MTEPDPEILAESVLRQSRAERDADITQELDSTKKIAEALAEDEPDEDPPSDS